MFGVNQKRLLEGLENIRERICCYIGPICDCKYGIKKMKPGPIEHFKWPRGERTGCPEIKMAMCLLSELNEDEFNSLCLKSGIVVDEVF
jgi:hypothetical protein